MLTPVFDAQGTDFKCQKAVTYAMHLDMARLCSEHARADGWPTKYDLIGVVRHKGVGTRKGHYTFIQKSSTGTFVSRDDTCVEEVTNPLAYKTEATGLLYQRCAPTRFEKLATLLQTQWLAM